MSTVDQAVKADAPVPTWKKVLLTGIGLALLMAWTGVALLYGYTALWGPYAHALSDAGPLFLSRLGGMLVFMICPLMALVVPLVHASSFRGWLGWQAYMLIPCVLMVLGHGYYLHHIVAWQGVDNSLNFLAGEVGFESAEAVPAHIKEAFVLSAKLAEEGKAPWLPGQWKEVAWPLMPPR